MYRDKYCDTTIQYWCDMHGYRGLSDTTYESHRQHTDNNIKEILVMNEDSNKIKKLIPNYIIIRK